MSTIPTTFKLDVPESDAVNLLADSYRLMVARRGGTLIEDADTVGKIQKAAKWLTIGSKVGLLLYGSVGNGKTTLLRAIAEVIRITHYSAISSEAKFVRFITAMELAKLAKDRPEDFEKLIRCDMLAIDDIGTEPENVKHFGNVITPITEAIFFRHDRRLFTICTSNLDMDGMRERYDERIHDRMIEMFNRIAYTNKSYRR